MRFLRLVRAAVRYREPRLNAVAALFSAAWAQRQAREGVRLLRESGQ